MKVLHICTVDTGGAYQAVRRFSESMELSDVETDILVRTKMKEDSNCIEIFSNPFSKFLSKAKNGFNLLLSKGIICKDLFGTDISKNKKVLQADVIILHWVNSFLSCRSVEKLYKLHKPIIWVMHDMWLYTGGCHYDQYCGRYRERCGACPLINSNKDIDITRKNFWRKYTMIQAGNICITAPSKQMCEEAEKSLILENHTITYVPNTVNTDIFKNLKKKQEIRNRYGIKQDKKVILFGAADNGIANPTKGFQYLQEALKALSTEGYMLAIFGQSNSDILKEISLEYKELGYIADEQQLAEIYNMVDVFVSPANQEAFGFTLCEAMACEIPVVAFPTNGALEQIEHKKNGYIAKLHDAADLAEGINYCIENATKLGSNARKSVEAKYSYPRVGNVIATLCKQLVDSQEEKEQM